MIRRRIPTRFLRTRVFPYAMPFILAVLIGLAVMSIVRILLAPSDAVIIQVVPIGDDETLRVQVEGAVERPGVYELAPGSSVIDAVRHAGGTVDGAVLESNLEGTAVTDGQFIFVPEESAAGAEPAALIDINAASVTELETLPGIGPVIAARIVTYRETVGAFKTVDELAEVTGISERMVAELKTRIVVQPS